VTQDVTNIIAQVPSTIEALTGMDLLGAIGNLPGLKRSAETEDIPVKKEK
jgi:hypothetical protein